jgi:hypothetical protein
MPPNLRVIAQMQNRAGGAGGFQLREDIRFDSIRRSFSRYHESRWIIEREDC